MTARVIPFPRSGGPQSNAYGFPPVADLPLVDVCASLNGYRVFVGDIEVAEFATLTRAVRCAASLKQALAQEAVRRMLQASVADLAVTP